MPYIDIQNQDYENTLYLYTIGLRNGRYDIIDTKGIDSKYNNNATSVHSFDKIIDAYNNFINPKPTNTTTESTISDEEKEQKEKENKEKEISKYYYNTYNTYRKFITLDSSLLKVNETAVSHSLLNDNMFNVNYDISTNVYNLFDFKGIALNYYYPVNGRMSTLEDIFAEYFYDYIVAIDLQNDAENRGYYYFDKNLPYHLQFSYSIIPIGEKYKTEDDEESEPETILYDGTTVPTVYDIMLGNLYIVIKSGDMPARKIYFNNEYGPSLFINDDKYNIKYLGLTNTDSYRYILNDNQPARLCDITRFRSWGYSLLFPGDNTNGFLKYSVKPNYILDGEAPNITVTLLLDTFAALITSGTSTRSCINMVIGNDPGTINKKNIFSTDIPIKFYSGQFLFDNGFTMGNVLRPKSIDEQTSFIFAMIPYVVIEGGYSLSSIENKTINLTKNSTTAPIKVPLLGQQCKLNIAETILDKTNKETSKMYYEGTSVDIQITGNFENYNDAVNKTLATITSDKNTTFNDILNYGRALTLNMFDEEVKQQDKDNNIYGLLLHNIPFQDLTLYNMSNILSLDTSFTIKISSIEPGFFTKEEEFLPAYMEYTDDDEIPVFIEI